MCNDGNKNTGLFYNLQNSITLLNDVHFVQKGVYSVQNSDFCYYFHFIIKVTRFLKNSIKLSGLQNLIKIKLNTLNFELILIPSFGTEFKLLKKWKLFLLIENRKINRT